MLPTKTAVSALIFNLIPPQTTNQILDALKIGLRTTVDLEQLIDIRLNEVQRTDGQPNDDEPIDDSHRVSNTHTSAHFAKHGIVLFCKLKGLLKQLTILRVHGRYSTKKYH